VNEPPDEKDPTYVIPLSGTPALAPDKLRLVVLSGPDAGKAILLDLGTYLVGKSPSSQLQLSDSAVSWEHLEIRVQPAGIEVRDLGSTNGSFFGGARFDTITVGAGAIFGIGQTELKVAPAAVQLGILPSTSTSFYGLQGASLRMRQMYALLERASASDVPILIEGETGTGKELAAEAIHQASQRARGPFVVCDLAGVSRTLIESELYGHVRGAFTGADRDRAGAFELAAGGSIFIDELGELELDAQPRLLRAIERRQVKPVGSSSYKEVAVRVITATNRDLAAEVKAGRFREDLYHRLAVVRVQLPPLRERKEDIPLLADVFVGGRASLPPETLALLMEYDWPGNVRELRNVIERALSLAPQSEQVLLEPHLLGLAPTAAGHGSGPKVPMGTSYKEAKERLLQEWERTFIMDLLRRADGNVSKAARTGGLDRVYLHRLMKKHGIAGLDD
jgi:two-component system, NtrC family, nitrogen regulation response regulator GlnG